MIVRSIKACLSLFHFMKRMVDTLRTHHCMYWQAIIALKEAIYQYVSDHYEQLLLLSLRNGTIARDKKRYTPEEIKELRHSKKFKQQCAKYLRKVLNRG